MKVTPTCNKHFVPLALLSTFGALLCACSGGGGGSSSSINEGSYTKDDFTHNDTRQPGFQPLGTEGFRALSREELFAIVPTTSGPGGEHEMQEGPDEAYFQATGMEGLFDGFGAVIHAASGQLDGDAEDELVVLTLQGPTLLNVHRVDRIGQGQYVRERLYDVTPGTFSMVDARVSLGDVDNDFRDEIFVVARGAQFGLNSNRGQVWGFQDPLDGNGEILNFLRQGNHVNLWAYAVDADGDDSSEVVVALSGDSTDTGRFPIRMYDLPENGIAMVPVHGWQYLYGATDFNYGEMAVGDFDGDGRDNIAWVGYKDSGSSAVARIVLFEFSAAGTWTSFTTQSLVTFSPTTGVTANRFEALAFSPRVGQQDIAVAFPRASGWWFSALHYDRGLDQWQTVSSNLTRHLPGQSISLAASDVDSDGVEEIQVGLLHFGSQSTLDFGYLEIDTAVVEEWQPRRVDTAGSISGLMPGVVLANGDFDADGVTLQHTGRTDLRLGDPIPLVVLSAPPSKSGISQNYDDTESSYSQSQTAGNSVGVTTTSAITYGAEVGFDLFGILGVSGRASLDKATQRTQTNSKYETIVEGYRGAYDSDVIIFQGTLYETYEYVILSAPDPAAVGTFVTLDFPVQANTYKWTVDYYNQNVRPEDQIGMDVLTHSAGDIATYPSRAELDQELNGTLHWDLQASRPVSQGGASDFQLVSFGTEQASEVQRTITKSYGGGASIGIGGSVDKTNSNGSTHATTYGTETSFEASIGDISSPADYESWRYDWGFSVQTVGRTADGGNAPIGYTPRKHSFQYLRYWVNLNGSGY